MGLKHCWKPACLRSVLSKPCSVCVYRAWSVVGNCRSYVVQIEMDDGPKCSVQLVTSGPHPAVHIGLNVESAFSLQWMVRLLKRCKTLVPLA